MVIIIFLLSHHTIIPMQLLITSELSEEENLWLKNLTNDLSDINSIERLSIEYGKHEHNELYKSLMNIIIRANKEKFKEVKGMCEALRELFADELEMTRHEGIKSLILSCKKLGGTREVISDMVAENYKLTNIEAEEYMKLYW